MALADVTLRDAPYLIVFPLLLLLAVALVMAFAVRWIVRVAGSRSRRKPPS
jgi:hypothetical protein